MDLIPNEIMHMILDYLPIDNNTINYLLACRLWKYIIKSKSDYKRLRRLYEYIEKYSIKIKSNIPRQERIRRNERMYNILREKNLDNGISKINVCGNLLNTRYRIEFTDKSILFIEASCQGSDRIFIIIMSNDEFIHKQFCGYGGTSNVKYKIANIVIENRYVLGI